MSPLKELFKVAVGLWIGHQDADVVRIAHGRPKITPLLPSATP
jgi:hypothetical protein